MSSVTAPDSVVSEPSQVAGRLASMSVTFPPVTAPLASIVVIPTHNGWGWARRTLDAIREHADQRYEVIVCDNASSDETPRRLREIKNARVVLNAKNLGFGTACNQGAALARSPYVVFLEQRRRRPRELARAAPAASRIEPRRRRWAAAPEHGRLDPGMRLDVARRRVAGRPSRRIGRNRLFQGSRLRGGRLSCDQACLLSRRGRLRRVLRARVLRGRRSVLPPAVGGYEVVVEPRSVVTHALGVSSDQELKTASKPATSCSSPPAGGTPSRVAQRSRRAARCRRSFFATCPLMRRKKKCTHACGHAEPCPRRAGDASAAVPRHTSPVSS